MGEMLLDEFQLDVKTLGCAASGVEVVAHQAEKDQPLKERDVSLIIECLENCQCNM